MRRVMWIVPLTLIACKEAGPLVPAPETAPDLAAVLGLANGVPDDHPLAAGQADFLYQTWGTEVLGGWPPADFMAALQTEEPEVFGDQFAAFGFLSDPTGDMPIGLPRGTLDPDSVQLSCATCHVSELPDGRRWMGAPARSLDLGRFKVAVDERWEAAGNEPMMSPQLREKMLAPGPGRFLAETERYPKPVPADYPPYFDLGERTALNYIGTGKELKTEASFAIFGLGAGFPTPREAAVPFPGDEQLAPMLDFMAQLVPPEAPAQDPALARRGAEVFSASGCDGCHRVDDLSVGSITPVDLDGGDRIPGADGWPRGSIGTSPAHHALISKDDAVTEASGGEDEGYGPYIKLIFREGLKVRPTDGYRVAPLRGLWVTAPYLHNGSVPTLEALLTPPERRPTVWKRSDDFAVDTTQPGNSNAGHAFGVDLPPDDKAALIAWLLSL